jgi:hypothetical protein
MAFISEFTNEIYDQGNAAFQDQGDTTRVFLGVLVTLLPKVVKVHMCINKGSFFSKQIFQITILNLKFE